MRWQPKPRPKHGDTRTRTRWALRPTLIEDTMVWLEPYRILERFSDDFVGDRSQGAWVQADAWLPW